MTHKEQAALVVSREGERMSSEGKRAEVNAALHALYLNAPAEVARDVALKVNAALDESASEVERLREALERIAELKLGVNAPRRRAIARAALDTEPNMQNPDEGGIGD